jgi:glyoxylase-like metal-dependent hydrolase (beta-lactamase superfamily II)
MWLLMSRRWTHPLPINVYVVEHEHGLVLFDSGQDRRSVTDADYFPRGLAGLVYRRLATFQIGEEQTVPELLRAAGHDPSRVTHVVVSHLHQDHIGGLSEFPRAKVLLSPDEWSAHRRSGAEFAGYLTEHIDLPGVQWQFVEFEPTREAAIAEVFEEAYDLFSDGSMLILPTPGHTPGSLSLLVRRPGRTPLLFVGDLTYDAHHFDVGHIPGIGSSRLLRASTRRVQMLQERLHGLLVLAAHDPGAAPAMRAARDEGSVR